MSPDLASSAMNGPGPVVRPARQTEIPRATRLFSTASERPPARARFLLALRLRPVERIVAALAWWREEAGVRFLVASRPGVPLEPAVAALVPALETLPEAGGADIEYGCLLSEDKEPAAWLARHGYAAQRTERVFEASAASVHERIESSRSRHGAGIPASWTTESIRYHAPETVWPLIAPHRLIRLDALRRFWNTPGERGYDPEFSNILLDAGTPLGTLLVRTNPACLAVDIRVVKPIAPRLRALANLALFAHITRRITPATTTIRVLAFRADRADHQETANLALRMGGRQVDVRHIYTRPGDARETQHASRGE